MELLVSFIYLLQWITVPEMQEHGVACFVYILITMDNSRHRVVVQYNPPGCS